MNSNLNDKLESLSIDGDIPEVIKQQVEAEKNISENVMSIRLSPEGLIFKDDPSKSTDPTYHYGKDRLSGVYCQGVQYYDLSGVHFINNTGMANLIDLLKSLLEMGVEVQFANVDENIKEKIRKMGLEKIINCSDSPKVEKRILL
jgi:hypothetical protein